MQHPSSEEIQDQFSQNDVRLAEDAEAIREMRQQKGLEGLVGGLEGVIINTEPQMHERAVAELLRTTGMQAGECFAEATRRISRLQAANSPDLILQTRLQGDNPFWDLNMNPKSRFLPNTRLETFVFRTEDLAEYVRLQRDRGVAFMTEEIQQYPDYDFIQTRPSRFTNNSLGFIQWKNPGGSLAAAQAEPAAALPEKPALAHLDNIGRLDHCATRVTAAERDQAILEFMELTNYNFDFAIYVDSLNSITNVARLSDTDFAMVFTSGIAAATGPETAGPTEQFIVNYGRRVHHMAFATDNIDATYDALERDGMRFLVELVGSEEEGLQQTFTMPSKYTLLVNEYIHRYGDFDGFFTKSNVTTLTEATGRQ
ncbi:VOC family protein [Desulfohalobium retbaense]|uniref:VOC domain-containing protein n=1 Tax=Desulfohalobium retbaense (strain ATCC 49708 / DSM 5692 / JCM 16813 / HR100) TaxID=485915 RepID=C8WZJ7_DESRD|nr:VOC family protein [Desulfohalobium retbaense]ACV67472.1 conserved hypothetical protein [Desulfohalobium retbaense DSM 5692]